MLRGRGRGRGRGKGGNWRGENRLRGLFADGIWQCDCNPRLPAEHFKVKKEGKNQGRWFYTCQKPETERCAFFLWDEDAKTREEGVVLNNSRTELRSTTNATENSYNDARQVPSFVRAAVSPPPPYHSPEAPQQSSSRIGRQMSSDEDLVDENLDWPSVGGGGRRPQNSEVATPSKPRVADVFSTLGKRKFSEIGEAGLATPQTGGHAQNTFGIRTSMANNSTESKRRQTDTDFLDLVSPATTPTPSRFRGVEDGISDDTLFTDIKEALTRGNIALSDSVNESLKQVCGRTHLRTQGIMKGREISRLALKAKDAKIAELQHRIDTLEAELETERAIVKHLRWEKELDVE